MRKVIFSLLLASAGAIGLAGSTAAEAYDSGRIYVGIGDVTFSYGRPYWRHNHEPLYVVYERGYPRYYRVPTPAYPAYYAPPVRYVYAPPPRGRYYDHRYGYRDYRDHHRWDRDRDHRRDRGRHGRDRDRHRGW
jgi:hypothetical protein